MPLTKNGQQVIARALIDSTFQKSLAKDAQATLADPGLGLSKSDVTAIMGLKPHEWGNLKLSTVNRRISQAASFTGSTVTT
jgi:hypothetical protein